MSTLRVYALFTNDEAPVAGLTLSEIDFTILRVNKSSQAVNTITDAQDAEFEVGGGFYGYFLEDADTDTYDYIARAAYTGSTSVDDTNVFATVRGVGDTNPETILRLYGLFTFQGAAVTGLTLSQIDFTIFRVAESDQSVSTVVNAQDAAFETGGGFYAYYLNNADFATYDYIGYARYVGASAVDHTYVYNLAELSSPESSAVAPEFQALPYLTAVWVWDNSASAYVDRTHAARSNIDTVFGIFEDTNDYLYLGAQSRFDLTSFELTTVGSGLGTITREYWNGTAWTTFIPANEYDWSYDAGEEFGKLVNWTARTTSTTSPHSAAPPDTQSRYWIRISTSSVATAPTVGRIEIRPWASYCSPNDVYRFLQLKEDFTSSTVPSQETVEDYIHAAESYIDYISQKSWKLNMRLDEEYDFNIAGVKLVKRDPRRISRVQVWNGGGYDTIDEGRDQDYFLVPTTGMMMFSRYFLLPARLQSYNAPVWLWGWAEFTFPLRITYFHGRSIERDSEQGGEAFDMARKLAAKEIVRNHDYTLLMASGSDHIELRSKVEDWGREVEEKLESLRSWTVF